MLRVGTAGIPHSAEKRDTLSGIQRVAELGLSAMELEFVRGVNMNPVNARKAGSLARKLGVSLSVHAPYYVNLASVEDKKIQASIDRVFDAAVVGDAAGAEIVVFHPGFYSGRDPKEAGELIVEGVSVLRERLDDAGAEILLGPEAMGKLSQYGTIDELIKLSMEVQGCVPVVEWCHIHARSLGGLSSPKDYGGVLEKIRKKLGTTCFHMHFSGVEYTDRGEKKHLPFSSMQPDYAPLVAYKNK